MIRVVQTGDLGLDVLLGGGWRLVKRLDSGESATVVIRGGPGVGKTLMALESARALAAALGGDVAVGCVELLPSEYLAQVQSARGELYEANAVVVLPASAPEAPSTGARIYCGLLADLNPREPDLVAALEALRGQVIGAGGRPVVFIVDSLIEGYGLGASAPRLTADAVMKFAAQSGCGLVLCEETAGETPSPWVFAADTIIELGTEGSEPGRWIHVRKHRFGASATGSHPFEILGWGQPRVWPRTETWLTRHVQHDVLQAHGWVFFAGGLETSPLQWIKGLQPSPAPKDLGGPFTLIVAPALPIAISLAFGLLPKDSESERDFVIMLDPGGLRPDGWSSRDAVVHFTPTYRGPKAGLLDIIGVLGRHMTADEIERKPRRIIVGDIASIASSSEAEQWANAIATLAILLRETGCGIPLIAYASGTTDTPDAARALLRQQADCVIDVKLDVAGNAHGVATWRLDGVATQFLWAGGGEEPFSWQAKQSHVLKLPHPTRHRRGGR